MFAKNVEKNSDKYKKCKTTIDLSLLNDNKNQLFYKLLLFKQWV